MTKIHLAAAIRCAIAVCVLTTSACLTTGQRVQRVEPGMTQTEVESIMGRPDGVRVESGHELWTYADRFISGWSSTKTDYVIVFDAQGMVVEYGPVR